MSSKHSVSSSKRHHSSPEAHKKDKHADSERRSRSPHARHHFSNRHVAQSHRVSPKRLLSASKSDPVNELDLLTGDAKPRSGLSMANSSSSGHYQRPRDYNFRSRNNMGSGMRFGYIGSARPGDFGFRQGRDVRCFANFAQRRNATDRDFAGTSKSFERSNRTQQWLAKKEEEEGKPVMNLFDPCKVPTGKSYFTHDDRSNKQSRENGFDRKFNAPLGWRNAPKDHLAKYRTQSREIRGIPAQMSKYSDKDGLKQRNGFDDVWKHDLFQENQNQDCGTE
uniref:Btz domain-containing protein n=1 Tax=Syphacia muris TaxID=451379 RepID=A0A0N5B066_9BILA